jgi:uncharacterized protein YjbI with pentapeptide repeats
MLKRWAAWPRGTRWLAGGVAALLLAVVLAWVLFVPAADWLAHHDVDSATGSLHETALDNARGRLLTLGAGLFAAGALVFTARNFTVSRRTLELTEQGQVTDRYTKAIEQLGSDKLDVRIGGIYALERIARDSARDHPTVMEVLTAFIREHSREQWPPPDIGSSEQGRLTRPDVQAAVTVVGRRDAARDREYALFIDLTAAHLTGAQLVGAELTGAHLDRANLSGADLTAAHLTRADLSGADLSGADLLSAYLGGAYLNDADLTGAELNDADLTGAELTGADLTGADLTDASLRDAYLTGANLTNAHLGGAHLTNAHLDGADLTSAHLTDPTRGGADLSGAHLSGAMWPEGARVPEGWMVDGDSGCLKRAGQLSEVMTHYL